ncbi:zinc dependent phospholipase C family protein [uncultured Pseudodesulfovibrio sp.]|uniref:zinc dependent phospholipase C family protein n=1 Tax=uncultured Pseudodesulfovibrio sp. TaxID=2035858 RepID=UPI0029C8D41F|nr:zinc dependent phospholipase C family protein [uncultured Pseudodesulfovibrio sp.]
MPKELIHFKTALTTGDALSGTRFSSCLDSQPHGLLLGSVMHDALFYGINKNAGPLNRLAHQLHGVDGQDTFTLLRLQAEHASTLSDNNLATALFIGMVSHLYADVSMHPMVWHLSGNYFAPDKKAKSQARQRHRALESLMDMVICPDMIGRPLFSIKRLLRHVGDNLYKALPMKRLAELADISHDELIIGLHHAFSVFAALQGLYPNKTLSRILFAAAPFLPRQAAEIITLFYAPQLMKQAGTIRGPIQFCHPVTGIALSKSIETMIHEAATKASFFCRSLEDVVFLGKPLPQKEIGPSLDSGGSGTPADRMHHFANPPFPKLLQLFR